MDRRNDLVDEYGFPIPIGFDGRPERVTAPDRRQGSVRWLIAITSILFGTILLATAGPSAASKYFAWKALESERQGDVPAALTSLDYAIYWSQADSSNFLSRGRLLLEDRSRPNAAEQAVADLEQYRRMEPNDSDVKLMLAHALQWRALQTSPEQARDMHRRAVDLVSSMLVNSPDSIPLLNSGAYIRAVADIDLPGALDDIDRALKLLGDSAAAGGDELEFDAMRSLRDIAADLKYQTSRCDCLDTRGYILLKLERAEKACDVLTEACKLATQVAVRETLLYEQFNASPLRINRMKRRWRERRAVLIHHRGEAYQALGRDLDAKKDFLEAKSLGFDPPGGVF